ncbi:MAG: PAS domain-containing protein [Deltaproteobacteria bacterium]|nr:PAS domain-containing protein [Deltaproteobacteria bacterium]
MAVSVSRPVVEARTVAAGSDAHQLLQWLLFLRVVVATFVLGRVFVLGIQEARYAFFILITTHVLTALLSALFIQRLASREWFLYVQVYWDILFITGLVYLSGGVDSFFPFMYVLAVINASILLTRRATRIAGFACSALMIVVFVAQWRGLISLPNVEPDAPVITARDVVLKLVFHIFAIFAAAYLAGFLSERSRAVGLELARKQEDLEQLRARFEHMIRSVPMGILALDDHERVMFANPAALGILGRDARSDLTGRALREVMPELPPVLPRAGARHASASLEIADGRTIHLEIGHSPLVAGDGTRLGALVTFEDRTAIKTMEDAVRRTDRLAAVGKLAAGIAHEIRNPLASMSGSIQLLSRELKLDTVNAHLMDIVIRETERLNSLVTDFLAFARPGPVKEELVDARLIADDTAKVLENEPGCRAGIRVVREFSEPLFLRADPNQLRQVFWNLGINAVQAMPDGGELRLRGRLLGGPLEGFDGRVVEITVSDNGKGMDEDTLKAIFDPFFTTKERGTGLGLTTCHTIVEMFRGRILVESRPRKGTTFTVRFPAA